jgi:chitin synthase
MSFNVTFQAIIKREFLLCGWMVVYILLYILPISCTANILILLYETGYPVYSFFLPVYVFQCMNEFSWGNTRLVIGEGKEKKVIMKEKFDESMIPLKKFSSASQPPPFLKILT